MGKSYLKRIAAPKTWQILRKTTTYITKPSPGAHSLGHGMPLSVILKEVLNYSRNSREVKKVLGTNEIKVDGTSRKNPRFQVGIFDTIELSTGETFRMIINKNGKLDLVKIKKEEVHTKPCKIVGKTMVNGKVQLNLYDGNNIFVDKDGYKVGDTVIMSLPDRKITKHLKLDKKAQVFLIGGKHIGEMGHVEDISGSKIIYKDHSGNMIETSKSYAFVIGDAKPLVTVE
jgi:small subunit ribosomal protein S4e